MVHSFETHIAEVCGIREAVLLYHIDFWITKNKANEKHFYDGRYWTYNSSKAFAKLFPYLTQKVIEKLLARLIADGYLVKGNFSDNVLDRTSWYSLTEKYYYVKMGKCISPNGEIDFSKWGNEYICITDIINTDNNNIEFEKKVSNETYFSHSLVQNEILHDCERESKADSNLSPKPSQNQSTSKKGRQGDMTLFESLPKSKGYTEEFETFWAMYRKHNAKDKAFAYKSYCGALKNGATHTQLLEALKKQIEIWEIKKPDPNFIPMCSTWLNKKRFNDDFEAIKQQAISSQQLQQRPQSGYTKEKSYSEDGYELDEKGHRINPDPTNNFFCPHGFYDNREEYVEFINLFPEGRDILDPEVERADRIIEQNWLKEKARRREEKKRLSGV